MTESEVMDVGLSTDGHFFCLDCRTFLGGDRHCDGGSKHRVVPVNEAAGVHAVVDEVWGPPSVRHRAQQLARAGKQGAIAGSIGEIFEGCSGCDVAGGDLGEVFGAIVVILAVVFFVVIVAWAGLKLIEWLRRVAARPVARAAIASAPPVIDPFEGIARGDKLLEGPVSARHGLAMGMELRRDRWFGRGVMYREGFTKGFDVDLGERGRLRIPAGRVRIEDDGLELEEPFVIEGFLARRFTGAYPDQFSPVPFKQAVETAVLLGDRVAVSGPFETQLDDRPGEDMNYREGKTVLVPVGVPIIRVLSHATLG